MVFLLLHRTTTEMKSSSFNLASLMRASDLDSSDLFSLFRAILTRFQQNLGRRKKLHDDEAFVKRPNLESSEL